MIFHHIDTCLPCFVQNHCNGDSEQLIGVPVDSSTRYHHVKADLISEISSYDCKIPEGRTGEGIAAVNEYFAGIHPLKTFDRSLDRRSDDDTGESCYAWFRLTWEN